MWTAANRARRAAIEKKTRRYPTDVTDEEWSRVEGLLPKPRKTGRRRGVDLREVLNGIRYLARTGCGWRMLPVNFPPWQTVYWWFRRFVRLFLFRTIHDLALIVDRERAPDGKRARAAVFLIASRSRHRPLAPSGPSMAPRRLSAESAISPSTPTAACWPLT
jgi:putative transposase